MITRPLGLLSGKNSSFQPHTPKILFFPSHGTLYGVPEKRDPGSGLKKTFGLKKESQENHLKIHIILLFLLLQGFSACSVQTETVYVSVAASMTDVFKELLDRFALLQPQVKIRPNFASSGSLAKQIEQGAPADIYISANPKWMRYLLEKDLIEPGSEHTFAYNNLVFISSSTTLDVDLARLNQLERIALGSPQSVPAGQYARQAMTAAGVYAPLEQARKLVMAKDVRQALLYADRGEVDGAFVYATDAALAKTARILFVVPEKLYDRISYPLALTREGADKNAARSFYDYMSSPEALEVLTYFGFKAAR